MSHNHTILGQMLQMFSRFEFQKAVKETKPNIIQEVSAPGTTLSLCSSVNYQVKIV